MTETSAVLYVRQERVATVTLNRPPLNILDIPAIQALDDTLAHLDQEEGLQLVVLRGAGGRAFSAGVSVQDHTPDKIRPMLEGLHGAVRRLRGLAPVTVAAVHGHCLGGGMELALACDLVIATDDARFGQPEIELGCYPPVAAALYPSLLGSGRTLDLLLSGRTFLCDEAERLGLVTRRVATGDLAAAIERFAAEVTGKSAAVTRLIKQAVRAGSRLDERSFDEALAENERLYLEELAQTEDMGEGIAAFLEKRRPVWKHR
jgi:cyclohexa-1,5-dienecarbonyl-CoA hydratase